MVKEFDQFAKEYDQLLVDSIKLSGYPPQYFDEQKIREVSRNVKFKATMINFLNFGCGVGKSEVFIRKYFPNSRIYSADVSSESLREASERCKKLKGITFHHFEDVESFDPGVKFDIVFVANVFHHIPEEYHLTTLRHLNKLLDNDGLLFIFEHNPFNPLTRHAFNICEFDRGCKMIRAKKLKKNLRLAGFTKAGIYFTLFFPSGLKFLTFLEKYLVHVPVGAQYYAKCSK